MSRRSSHAASSSRHGTPPLITLYDTRAGHSTQPWAPNIWRIRFILNYKRLPYRTIWVEFPDVENTLRAIGAPPSTTRPDGRPVYTLPVIVDPMRSSRPTILANTNNIAEYLETAYPARPVFPDGSRAVQTLFVHWIQEVFAKPLLPIMVPLSHQRLPERSRSHFLGGSPIGYPAPGLPSPGYPMSMGPQREQAWAAVKEQFDFLAMILDKNSVDGDGVVTMGSHLSYVDFAICSVLIWVERMAPHDEWSRLRQWNGGRWSRLYDRCREYMDEQ
ncbi:hypothetical protein HGRIS_014356 [Hohenbuehelia grisea]|uniref:GST N-terminal domain-containing protein n=1 Tax=Hohenbuehelia grisea TaxID=104357 RepID=A0ABR3JTC8_9AGAR